jgi:hypothetical protein
VAHQTIDFANGGRDPQDLRNDPGIKADQALALEEKINFRNWNGSVLGSVGYIFRGYNLYPLLGESSFGGDASRSQIFLKCSGF